MTAPSSKILRPSLLALLLSTWAGVVCAADNPPVIGGDSISLSIAAASIIAKVTRDRLMREHASEFPHYGFERHVGYGTECHQEALRIHGPCKLHRRSFAPIRLLLEQRAA